MKLKNCWEIMKCGREPNGKNEHLGICPATQSNKFNGINNGKFGGRFCWAFAGTFCKGEVLGTVAKKINDCSECAFFQLVNEEEGEKFIFSQDEADAQVLL